MMTNLQDYLTVDLDVEYAKNLVYSGKIEDFTEKIDGYSVGFHRYKRSKRNAHRLKIRAG